VIQLGHAGKLPANLGLGGRPAVQEHLADRPALQPGHQHYPATALLARQAVGEPVALTEDCHQRGRAGVGRRPDLQVRGHEVRLAILQSPSTCSAPDSPGPQRSVVLADRYDLRLAVVLCTPSGAVERLEKDREVNAFSRERFSSPARGGCEPAGCSIT
jgi:hypothetical protein